MRGKIAMKLLYSWLRELTGTELEPVELADALTMHGTKIDSMERTAGAYERMVAGRVLDGTLQDARRTVELAAATWGLLAFGDGMAGLTGMALGGPALGIYLYRFRRHVPGSRPMGPAAGNGPGRSPSPGTSACQGAASGLRETGTYHSSGLH